MTYQRAPPKSNKIDRIARVNVVFPQGTSDRNLPLRFDTCTGVRQKNLRRKSARLRKRTATS